MPLSSSIVGFSGDVFESTIDARWTMAYAAALGDDLPCYMDTRAAGGVVAHPLFPVCFEWEPITRLRAGTNALRADEAVRGVHATHDLVMVRPIRPPEKLRTRLTVVGVTRTRAGAYQLTRADTVDTNGATVCTSWYGTVYRGVDVQGDDRPAAGIAAPPSAPSSAPKTEVSFAVAPGLAHIYTECARIWNPIHTDAAVAARAGLPQIILHGTATLALTVSRIVESEAGGDPTKVVRIAGRFTGMVLMPSALCLRIFERSPSAAAIPFDVLNPDSRSAIQNGLVELRS